MDQGSNEGVKNDLAWLSPKLIRLGHAGESQAGSKGVGAEGVTTKFPSLLYYPASA
jgi:hypothetical protein